ncbi:MAG: anti-sigma factor antagonist [Firmicutes bacterium HGW-Firmicutes-13]|nr:MAG: anti-sigma factor antagonist [Firmicutes bacterium HGW-Firmicutes-13]
MKVNRITGNKAVIILEDKINISNSEELKDKLLALYTDGVNMITINFLNVSSIDSSGLGKLLLFQKKLKERQGELKIINVTSEHIRKKFDLINLDEIITIES